MASCQERRPFAQRRFHLHLPSESASLPIHPALVTNGAQALRPRDPSTARRGSSPPPRVGGSESSQHVGLTPGEEAEGQSSPHLDPSCHLFAPHQMRTQGLLCPSPGQPLAFYPRPEEEEDRFGHFLADISQGQSRPWSPPTGPSCQMKSGFLSGFGKLQTRVERKQRQVRRLGPARPLSRGQLRSARRWGGRKGKVLLVQSWCLWQSS